MINTMKLVKAPVISLAMSMKGIYQSHFQLERIWCHCPEELGVKEKQGCSISGAVTKNPGSAVYGGVKLYYPIIWDCNKPR